MRKNILVLLCVAFIIQFTGLLPLQAGHYYYKQISLKDGLPSTVRCILTDEQGFVWIGTRSGLGRYDGHELKKYVHVVWHFKTSLLTHNYYKPKTDFFLLFIVMIFNVLLYTTRFLKFLVHLRLFY